MFNTSDKQLVYSLIFSVLDTQIDGITNKIGLLGKSFSDIFSDLKSGRGIFTSLFADVVSNDEIIRVTDYINAVQNGLMSQEAAWDTYMKSAGSAAQGWARDVSAGRKSIDDLSTATLTARSAFQSLGKVALNVGASILNAGLSFAVFYGVSKIFEAISDAIVTTEEAAQNMTDAFAEYDAAKQKVVDINTELSNIQTQMDALSLKKGLTFVEQGELENLKEVTRQLETQKQLAEWEEKRAAEKAAYAAEDKWNKTNRKDERYSADLVERYYRGMSGEYSRYLDFDGGQDINALLAAYRGFTEQRDRYAEIIQGFIDKPYEELDAEQQWAIDYYNDTLVGLDAVEGALQDYAITYGEYYDAFMDLPVESLDSDQKAILQIVEQTTDIIRKTLDPSGWKQDKLDQIFENEALAKQRQELVELAAANKSVGLSIEDIDTTKYGALLDELDKLSKVGIGYQDFVDSVNSAANVLNLDEARLQAEKKFEQEKVAAATEDAKVEVEVTPVATWDDLESWFDKLPKEQQEIVLRWKLDDNMDTSKFTLDDWKQKLEKHLASNIKPSFSEIVRDTEDDNDYYDRIQNILEQDQEISDALKQWESGKLKPSDYLELAGQYEEIAATGFDNFDKGVEAARRRLSGQYDEDTGKMTGLAGIFSEMYQAMERTPDNWMQLSKYQEIIRGIVDTHSKATPVFEDFQDALGSMGDYVDLEKSLIDELDLGFSVDTIHAARDLLGEQFEEIFVFDEGQYKLVDDGFERLQQIYVDGLLSVTDLPDGIDQNTAPEWVASIWETMLKQSIETETQLERVSKAFEKVQNISSFITEAGSGEMGYLEMLESATDLLEDLPYGTKLQDLFRFSPDDIKVNEEFLNAQLDARIDSMLRLAGLDKVASNEFKTRIKQEMQEQQTLEKYSNIIDKASNASSLLSQAQEEMSASGKNSVDTYSELLDLFGAEAEKMVTIGADGIVIDQQAVKDKMRSEIDEVFGDNALGKQLKDQLEVEIETVSFEDALNGVSDAADLYRSIQEELDSGEGLSLNTVMAGKNLLGDAFSEVFTITDGQFALVDNGLENLRAHVLEQAAKITKLPGEITPDEYVEAIGASFDALVSQIGASITPAEKFADALSDINSVVGYMSDIGSDDFTFIDALESATDIISDLPEGVELGFEDFFSFDDKGDVEYLTGFYDTLMDAYINNLIDSGVVAEENKEKAREALEADIERTKQLAEQTDAFDKLSDSASLYHKIQDEMAESEAVSFDTFMSAWQSLGDGVWDYFSIDESGKILAKNLDGLKQSMLDLNPENVENWAALVESAFAEASEEVKSFEDRISEVSSGANLLSAIQDDIDSTGNLSTDTIEDIFSTFGKDAAKYLTLDTNGQLVADTEAIRGYYENIVNIACDEAGFQADDPKFNQIKQALLDSLIITPEDLSVENLENGLNNLSDAADLYKSIKNDLDSSGEISFDTITTALSVLQGQFWDFFEFKDGKFSLKKSLEEFKSAFVEGLYNFLPDKVKDEVSEESFNSTIGAWFDSAISKSEEAQTALEKLQDAFGKMSSISDFMTEMTTGDLTFVEQLEAGIELLDSLPEGTKLSDIFSFADGKAIANVELLNAQLDKQIASIVELANLQGEEAEAFKRNAKSQAAEERELAKWSNTMDKASDASSLLSQAQEEITESGKNSISTLQDMMNMFGADAINMYTFGADGLVIDQEAIRSKMHQEIEQTFGKGTPISEAIKKEMEVEIETVSFDDALDNYTSKTETLKDALETLKTEELSEADYFELIREFPELTKYTDDLSTGIKTLLSQNVDEISKAFDTQIDLADTPEKVAQLQELKRAALELATLEDVTIVIDVEAETEGFEKLQTAISESASATGMSADSVEALRLRYSGLMGELDAGVELFQRTANGITLNTQAAQKLERAYQKQNLDRVDRELQSLTAQYDALNDAILSTNDVAEIDSLYNQRNGIAKQIQELAELRSQYAGLTSSFNAWQSAQSSANERDSYESVGAGYEEMKKLFDSGWYGDDSLNSYLDLMFGDDRQKDIQSMTAQMEKLGEMNERYWTKDKDGNSTTDGLFNFLDDIEKNQETQGIITKELDKITGKEVYGFDFNAENIEKISNAFGMSAEMVGLFASALNDAGGNVTFYDEYADKLIGIGKASESTKKQIANIGEEAGVSSEKMKALTEYSIEDMDRGDIAQKIAEYNKAISETPELNTAETQAEIDRLVRQDLTLAVNAELTGADGKSIDQLLEMGDDHLAAALNIDTTQVDEARAQLEALKNAGSEVAMTVKLDESQLEQLTSKDLNGEVEYTANFDAIDGTPPPPLKGVVNYEARFGEISAPTVYGNIVYRSTTVASKADGTAHVQGTAFARGSWGVNDAGVALGGELGQETIVRDGQFFTIGDQGAEFFRYQKGDIIFNHKQTEELFKYGYVTSGGGRGKAYAGGTAKSGRAFFDGYQSYGNGLYRRPNSITPAKKPNKSNDSSSNSSAEKAAEEAKEVFDWIEVAIDRIERAIDTLDLKASSVYRAWTERNKNLTDEMEKLREEIDLQQRGYERYLEEANSVGLEEEWAKLVRDGEIDIDRVNDEELAKRIKEYQEWYK